MPRFCRHCSAIYCAAASFAGDGNPHEHQLRQLFRPAIGRRRQRRLCRLRVIGEGHERRVILTRNRVHHGVRLLVRAVREAGLDQPVAVDRQDQRLAHLGVVHRRAGGVEPEVLAGRDRRPRREIRAKVQHDGRGDQFGMGLILAGFQHLGRGHVVFDRGQLDPGQLGRRAEEVRVRHPDHRARVQIDALHHERPRESRHWRPGTSPPSRCHPRPARPRP